MKPVLGSVITTAVLALLANVALLASLFAPSSSDTTLLAMAGVLILAALVVGGAAALRGRRPLRTHPSIRLVAPPPRPAPIRPREAMAVHAN